MYVWVKWAAGHVGSDLLSSSSRLVCLHVAETGRDAARNARKHTMGSARPQFPEKVACASARVHAWYVIPECERKTRLPVHPGAGVSSATARHLNQTAATSGRQSAAVKENSEHAGVTCSTFSLFKH